MSHWGWVKRRLHRSFRVRVGLLVMALIVLPAIFAELVAADAPVFASGASGVVVFPAVVAPDRYDGLDRQQIAALHADDFAIWPLVRSGPLSPSDAGRNAPSTWDHPLGTDHHGHDVLARIVYGARTAIGLALMALLLALVFGGTLGILAGYLGGFWDEVLSRPVEFVQAFPSIIVVAAVRAVFPDSSLWSLVLAVAAVRWAEVARLVRAEVVRCGASDYVLAARALGCTNLRILRRHIVPSAVRPVVVSSMFGLGSVVLLEVAVSFLGFGSEVSWGTMLADGLKFEPAGTAAMCAGAMLAMTVFAAYLLADAVNDALDARVATAAHRFGH